MKTHRNNIALRFIRRYFSKKVLVKLSFTKIKILKTIKNLGKLAFQEARLHRKMYALSRFQALRSTLGDFVSFQNAQTKNDKKNAILPVKSLIDDQFQSKQANCASNLLLTPLILPQRVHLDLFELRKKIQKRQRKNAIICSIMKIESIFWKEVFEKAKEQGVSYICYDSFSSNGMQNFQELIDCCKIELGFNKLQKPSQKDKEEHSLNYLANSQANLALIIVLKHQILFDQKEINFSFPYQRFQNKDASFSHLGLPHYQSPQKISISIDCFVSFFRIEIGA